MSFFQIWIASSRGLSFQVPLSNKQANQALVAIAKIKGKSELIEKIIKDFSDDQSVSQISKSKPQKFLITLPRGLNQELLNSEIIKRLGFNLPNYKITGIHSNDSVVHYHVLGY
jgi:hypothetical protein